MSKQPCVWVVEMKWSGGWLGWPRYTFRYRSGANNVMRRVQRDLDLGCKQKFRVAKYVRVEPKKKKGCK